MRDLSIATRVFFFLLFTTFLPAAAYGEDGVSAQVVETEGSAPVVDQDIARARGEAVLNAMQKELAILGVQVARVYAVSTLTKKGVSELQQEVMGELFESVPAAVTSNPKARH